MKTNKSLIGMVHLQALPGTPNSKLSIQEIITHALTEAKFLLDAGFDGILLENMHDRPYEARKANHITVAAMTAVACEIRKLTSKPVGIQILAGANCESIAVAKAAQLNFIRAEGFVFAHIADEGYMNSDAAELLRYRKYIGAENIEIWTDIKKKHASHTITSDYSISETVKAAEFFLSDGIIITGTETGKEALQKDVYDARTITNLPIIIGSGITAENLDNYFNLAEVFIVGSFINKEGRWYNNIDLERVNNLISKYYKLKKYNGLQ